MFPPPFNAAGQAASPARSRSPTQHHVGSNSRGRSGNFFRNLRDRTTRTRISIEQARNIQLETRMQQQAIQYQQLAAQTQQQLQEQQAQIEQLRAQIQDQAGAEAEDQTGSMASALERKKRSKLPGTSDGGSNDTGSEGKSRESIDHAAQPAINAMVGQGYSVRPTTERREAMVPRDARGFGDTDTDTAMEMIKLLDAEAPRGGIGGPEYGSLTSHMDYDDDEEEHEEHEEREVSHSHSREHKQHTPSVQHNQPPQGKVSQGKVKDEHTAPNQATTTLALPASSGGGAQAVSGDVEQRLDAIPGHVTMLGPDGEYWSFGKGPPGECLYRDHFDELTARKLLGGEVLTRTSKKRAEEVVDWCDHYHFGDTNASGNAIFDVDVIAKLRNLQSKLKWDWIKNKLLKRISADTEDDVQDPTRSSDPTPLPNSFSNHSLASQKAASDQLFPGMIHSRNYGDRLSAVWDPACAPHTSLAKGSPGAFEIIPRKGVQKMRSNFEVGTNAGAVFGRPRTNVADDDVEGFAEGANLSDLFTRPTEQQVDAMLAHGTPSPTHQTDKRLAFTRNITITEDVDGQQSPGSPTSPVTPWVHQKPSMIPKPAITRPRSPPVPRSPTRPMRRSKSDQSMNTTASKLIIAPPIPPMPKQRYRVETTIQDSMHKYRVTKVVTPKMPSSPEDAGWDDAVKWARRNLKEIYAREEAARKAKLAEESIDPKAVAEAERRIKVKAGKKLIERVSRYGWEPKKPIYEMSADEYEAYGLACEALMTKDKDGSGLKKLFKLAVAKLVPEASIKRPKTPEPGARSMLDEALPPVPQARGYLNPSTPGASSSPGDAPPALPAKSLLRSNVPHPSDVASANRAQAKTAETAVAPNTQETTKAGHTEPAAYIHWEEEGIIDTPDLVDADGKKVPRMRKHHLFDLWINDNESSAASIGEHRKETLQMLEDEQESEGRCCGTHITESPVGLGITIPDGTASRIEEHSELEVKPAEPNDDHGDDTSAYSQAIDGTPSLLAEPTFRVRPSSKHLDHLDRGHLVPRRNDSFKRKITEFSERRAVKIASHPALRSPDVSQGPVTVSTAPPVPFKSRDWANMPAARGEPRGAQRPVFQLPVIHSEHDSLPSMPSKVPRYSKSLAQMHSTTDDVFAARNGDQKRNLRGVEGVYKRPQTVALAQHRFMAGIDEVAEIGEDGTFFGNQPDQSRTGEVVAMREVSQHFGLLQEASLLATSEDDDAWFDEDETELRDGVTPQEHDDDAVIDGSTLVNSFIYDDSHVDEDMAYGRRSVSGDAKEEFVGMTRIGSAQDERRPRFDDEVVSRRTLSSPRGRAISDRVTDIPRVANHSLARAMTDVGTTSDIADRYSRPVLVVDIDDVIQQWHDSTPPHGQPHRSPAADCPEVQSLRAIMDLPLLRERRSGVSLAHPNHPYSFKTQKLMCYGVHNPPFDGSPNRMRPKQCSSCESVCCRFAQLLLMSAVPGTDVLAETCRIRARIRVEKLCSLYPNGIEEYDTFLACAECSMTVCPSCAVVCQQPICHQVYCRRCGSQGCGFH